MAYAIHAQKIKAAIWVVVTIVAAGLLVWGIIAYGRYRSAHLPGVIYSDQGRNHVGPGYQFSYNSNPPTSGPHFAQPAEWGVYKEELPDGTMLHNLEHGGIWISFKPGIPDDIKTKLEAFYQKYGRKIIVAPRAANDADIAVAAWGHLDKFDAADYSDDRVNRFIKAFRNKGPEFVP